MIYPKLYSIYLRGTLTCEDPECARLELFLHSCCVGGQGVVV